MLSVLVKLVQQVSPDQLYSAGYRDGINGRSYSPLYRETVEYLKGYVAGYRANPASLYNLAPTSEVPLERGWSDELLNPL